MRKILLAAMMATACGGGTPIASTTSSYKRPDHAPPPPDTSATTTTGVAAVPPSEDAQERLIFTRAGSIWMMKPDGKDQARVTARGGAPDETPMLSPNGLDVAFVSSREGASKIYIAAADGTITRPLTDGAEGGDHHPAWTPDGKHLVFMRGKPETRRDLYLVAEDGSAAPRKLLDGRDDTPVLSGHPAVSPDGKTIVFASDRGEGTGTGLFLVGIDGKGIRRLTRPPQSLSWIVDTRPAWSPDGKRIAFASNRHGSSADDGGDFDLYAVDVESGRITRLTTDQAVADDPVYSPDGKRLYFTSTRDATRAYSVELYVMPATGGEQIRLTRDETPQNAAPSAGRIKCNEFCNPRHRCSPRTAPSHSGG